MVTFPRVLAHDPLGLDPCPFLALIIPSVGIASVWRSGFGFCRSGSGAFLLSVVVG